jgi:type IV pilus assembly protein PilV
MLPMTSQTHRPGRARGFSLIELLVGVLIISFGLLGLLTLQGRALQMSTTNDDAQRAALLANEMAAEMINANNVVVPDGIRERWAARAADPASGGMPNGQVTIEVTGNRARITVTWRPGSTTDGNDFRYFTDVTIPQ